MADDFEMYQRWLSCNLTQNICEDKKFVHDSFDSIQNSLAYQKEVLVNGTPHSMAVTRTNPKKCNVAIKSDSILKIGDLVTVFNERWICVELYQDEFEMIYGVLWLCNQVFHYQDFNYNTINKYAIIDDGSYSKGNDKAIPVTNNSYNCYISYDDESKALYVDKRLGISVVSDAKGKSILEVGRIKWIDIKSKNFGEGSHLMIFGISDDQYNPEEDNIDKLICNYKEHAIDGTLPIADEIKQNEAISKNNNASIYEGELFINGKKTIHVGCTRSYTLGALDYKTGESIALPNNVEWHMESDNKGISIEPSGAVCRVTVKEDDNLVGIFFTLKCINLTGQYKDCSLSVEVI